MEESDATDALAARVHDALTDATPLAIVGGASKTFIGRPSNALELNTQEHRGIVSYEPAELVLTARTGTPLSVVESVLRDNGQMLAFEPPHFGENATLGGTIACGLSGPRRPYAGSARDFVLGVKLINGQGEVLSFGGQVMKNVAGYDVSRLMTGAMGTLGVLLDVSLKVLPRPQVEQTRVLDCQTAQAIKKMNAWAARPLPITAACHLDSKLYVRLSGTEHGVTSGVKHLGGERLEDGADFWDALREQQLDFFTTDAPLWRVSVPPGSDELALPGRSMMDWGGGLRWAVTDAPARTLHDQAARIGGHAMLFRNGDRSGDVYHPLSEELLKLHKRLKQAFDPSGLFNPGRMYPGL